MKRSHFYLLCVTTFILVVGCKGQSTPEKRLDTFPVRVEKVARQDLEETLTLVGTIKAKDEATLFSRVPGKLQKNLVKEGDRIEKDSPVALVERDEVGVKFEPAPVPSTLTGVVARVYLDRGANVTLTTPVALVVDQREVYAKADVPERYSGKVAVGQDVRVRVDAFPDQTFAGRISRLSPVVDAATRSTYMEARIDNAADRLKSGMFAKVSVVIARRARTLAVPVEALTDGPAQVFVAKGGAAHKREIEIGVKTESRVEILKGLSEGDDVITFGLFGLKDGSPIEVLQ